MSFSSLAACCGGEGETGWIVYRGMGWCASPGWWRCLLTVPLHTIMLSTLTPHTHLFHCFFEVACFADTLKVVLVHLDGAKRENGGRLGVQQPILPLSLLLVVGTILIYVLGLLWGGTRYVIHIVYGDQPLSLDATCLFASHGYRSANTMVTLNIVDSSVQQLQRLSCESCRGCVSQNRAK